MKPEPWQELDKLFHSALEREPAQRGAFLEKACAALYIHFIATEFIDGQTLRQQITGSQARVAGGGGRIAGTGLKLSEVLNIAM